MATHLTQHELIIIHDLREQGKSLRAIAAVLGRGKSTVSDELSRNRTIGCNYCPVVAQAKAEKRQKKPRVIRKMRIPFLRDFVLTHLQMKWAPEQISGRLTVLYPDDLKRRISAETIYKWIWSQKKQKKGDWHKHLRSGLKKSRRGWRREDGRGKRVYKDRVGIEHRPTSVEQRLFIGDWEGDTVVGRLGQYRIASWVERKCRFVCLALVQGSGSKALNKAVLKRFKESPQLPVRTITLDNGAEFSRHLELSEALHCMTYFARPHRPWERGTNENMNGLLRQFYPKGTDFNKLTTENLAEIEYLLNTRPRKCLQYRTPMEAMNDALARRVRIGN